MNELTNQKYMTVAEVATALNVTAQTVRNYIDKLAKDRLPVQNNQGGYMLTEPEVTAIKLSLQQNPYIDDVAELPKTALEKTLLVRQAMAILAEQVQELEAEKAIMEPKAESYDAFMSEEGTLDMGNVAKTLNLGMGRNQLFALLRGMNVLKDDNVPYQEYVDRGYFKIVPVVTHIGIKMKTIVFPKGVDWIRRLVE